MRVRTHICCAATSKVSPLQLFFSLSFFISASSKVREPPPAPALHHPHHIKDSISLLQWSNFFFSSSTSFFPCRRRNEKFVRKIYHGKQHEILGEERGNFLDYRECLHARCNRLINLVRKYLSSLELRDESSFRDGARWENKFYAIKKAFLKPSR